MRVTRNRNKSKRKSTLKFPPLTSLLSLLLPLPSPCHALLHLHLQHAVKCCRARDGHTTHKTITKDTSEEREREEGEGKRGRWRVPGQPLTYSVCQSLCHFSLSNNNRTKSKAEKRRRQRERGREKKAKVPAKWLLLLLLPALLWFTQSCQQQL